MSKIIEAQVARVARLFRGNSRAHYVRRDSGAPLAVYRGATLDDFVRHLNGRPPSLLSVPTDATGSSHFGCIDVDAHGDSPPVDQPALARRVTELGLPLVVCRSTGGRGAWLFLFIREPAGVSSFEVQHYLLSCAVTLGYYGAEVFPKQLDTSRGKHCGSGVNLPYFGDSRIAFGPNGEELDLDGFLALAEERATSGHFLENARIRLETQGFGNNSSNGSAIPIRGHEKPPGQNRPEGLVQRSTGDAPTPDYTMHFWRVPEHLESLLRDLAEATPGHRHEKLLIAACFAARASLAGFFDSPAVHASAQAMLGTHVPFRTTTEVKARIEAICGTIFSEPDRGDKKEIGDCWRYGAADGPLDVDVYPWELERVWQIGEEKWMRAFDGDTSDFPSAIAAKEYVVARLKEVGIPDPRHVLRISRIDAAVAEEVLFDLEMEQALENLKAKAST